MKRFALLPAVDSESELVVSFARPSSTYLLETDSNCPHYFCTYDRKQVKNMEFQLSDPAFLDTLGPGTRMLSYSFGGHGLGAPVGDVVVAIDEHGKIIGWMNSNCSHIKYCNGVLEHWKGH